MAALQAQAQGYGHVRAPRPPWGAAAPGRAVQGCLFKINGLPGADFKCAGLLNSGAAARAASAPLAAAGRRAGL